MQILQCTIFHAKQGFVLYFFEKNDVSYQKISNPNIRAVDIHIMTTHDDDVERDRKRAKKEAASKNAAEDEKIDESLLRIKRFFNRSCIYFMIFST